ncbi:MAG TPA: hypothetical protein VNQ99_14990 [Xanthobacteraceae bacterium]|nr:hypothetical protein [Xanthobacteraceae bacterium]
MAATVAAGGAAPAFPMARRRIQPPAGVVASGGIGMDFPVSAAHLIVLVMF